MAVSGVTSIVREAVTSSGITEIEQNAYLTTHSLLHSLLVGRLISLWESTGTSAFPKNYVIRMSSWPGFAVAFPIALIESAVRGIFGIFASIFGSRNQEIDRFQGAKACLLVALQCIQSYSLQSDSCRLSRTLWNRLGPRHVTIVHLPPTPRVEEVGTPSPVVRSEESSPSPSRPRRALTRAVDALRTPRGCASTIERTVIQVERDIDQARERIREAVRQGSIGRVVAGCANGAVNVLQDSGALVVEGARQVARGAAQGVTGVYPEGDRAMPVTNIVGIVGGAAGGVVGTLTGGPVGGGIGGAVGTIGGRALAGGTVAAARVVGEVVRTARSPSTSPRRVRLENGGSPQRSIIACLDSPRQSPIFPLQEFTVTARSATVVSSEIPVVGLQQPRARSVTPPLPHPPPRVLQRRYGGAIGGEEAGVSHRHPRRRSVVAAVHGVVRNAEAAVDAVATRIERARRHL